MPFIPLPPAGSAGGLPKFDSSKDKRLRSAPFEGAAIVKPPALPVDTYLITVATTWAEEQSGKLAAVSAADRRDRAKLGKVFCSTA